MGGEQADVSDAGQSILFLHLGSGEEADGRGTVGPPEGRRADPFDLVHAPVEGQLGVVADRPTDRSDLDATLFVDGDQEEWEAGPIDPPTPDGPDVVGLRAAL